MATNKPRPSIASADTELAHVTPADGNVFLDLGFPPAEAENLRLRSLLMIALGEVIESRRLTQARAAAMFGVTQPRVSDLVRGKIALFSIDALVNMLASAGYRVHLTVEAPAPSKTRTGAPSRTRPSTSHPARTRSTRAR